MADLVASSHRLSTRPSPSYIDMPGSSSRRPYMTVMVSLVSYYWRTGSALRCAAFQQVRYDPAAVTRLQRRHSSIVFSSTLANSHQANDEDYMQLALDHARRGVGHTFPNPAVGCVLVRNNQVIGSGFHPRAGMPHAEVFALFEACGHVSDGVVAAESVLKQDEDSNPDLLQRVVELSESYMETGGPERLFGKALAKDVPVTAYVTLEPCCHVGKTPPCASSLVLAGVDRVVVGVRDPNPRVDGGGVRFLEEAEIKVDLLENNSPVAEACNQVVDCFVKRITPRDIDYSEIRGAMRSALRSLAGRSKAAGTLVEHTWPSRDPSIDTSLGSIMDSAVDALRLDPSWLEAADASLWNHELVLLRLSNAVKKKKGAKRLGERIAKELGAHIAQTLGHTVLLYRPGVPPQLDLAQLVADQRMGSSKLE